MKYYINYNTGAGNAWIDGTLADAKAAADAGAAYTQCDIVIEGEDGNEAARRPWWGVAYDSEETDEAECEIISFGGFGYFGRWE